MDWETSTVMSEFTKIAKDKGLVKKAKYPDNPHGEDPKTIEEKRMEAPEEHIMEQAHPESVYVAEARGEGGLVENEIEHQRKIVEMINKMPTGSLVGRYASAANDLVKFAGVCEELGHEDAADSLLLAAGTVVDRMEGSKDPLK